MTLRLPSFLWLISACLVTAIAADEQPGASANSDTGICIAAGHGGHRMSSLDGITWTNHEFWDKPAHNQNDLKARARIPAQGTINTTLQRRFFILALWNKCQLPMCAMHSTESLRIGSNAGAAKNNLFPKEPARFPKNALLPHLEGWTSVCFPAPSFRKLSPRTLLP